MERITRLRSGLLMGLFVLIVCFFGWKLFRLQVVETKGKTDNQTTFTSVTRVKAARGDILDRNGNAMVSNRASYDLVFNYYVIFSADGTNDALLRLVKLCQEQGIAYNEHFPVSKTRPFSYTLEDYSSAYQGYFQSYLASRGNLDSDITAPLLMKKLRTAYGIPEDWSDEDARLVIGVRYELALRGGITNLPNYVFIEDAADTVLSAIRELNVPGLNVEPSTVREYNTKYAAHILGFVGAMSPEQWEHYKNVEGYEMDSQVGQDGLEKAFEEQLHGVDGLREDVVTADGTVVSTRYLQEPKAGNNVEISIDLNLQTIAENELADTIEKLRASTNEKADGKDAQGGAVVAMNVKTGEILVCGSYPTYDLSRYFEDYEEILKTEYDPLFNRALQGTYPPGSTYKMSMVVAAINTGIINSQTTIYDKGVFDKYDNFAPTCLAYASGYSHGDINAAEALQESCNYFFYVLGDELSIDVMDATAKGFGLGEATGVELYEEVGHRSNPTTKEEIYTGSDAQWYTGDQILTAIGQADNRFTPLQLCVYASTLANRGTRYGATFMNRVVSADYRSLVEENIPKVLSTIEIKDEAYQTYLTGMKLVCTDGTAESVFGDYPISVAAKTGTAETDKVGASANGSFLCFAPADDPEIAIAVYGEQAGHGTSIATVAKAILDSYFEVDTTGDAVAEENQVG